MLLVGGSRYPMELVKVCGSWPGHHSHQHFILATMQEPIERISTPHPRKEVEHTITYILSSPSDIVITYNLPSTSNIIVCSTFVTLIYTWWGEESSQSEYVPLKWVYPSQCPFGLYGNGPNHGDSSTHLMNRCRPKPLTRHYQKPTIFTFINSQKMRDRVGYSKILINKKGF